ncbi:MAG TPA: hypothetical protein VI819_04240 [Patescibacteria group bacterium]|nr:hypothetical protein [Patescibacteria group bacterium]
MIEANRLNLWGNGMGICLIKDLPLKSRLTYSSINFGRSLVPGKTGWVRDDKESLFVHEVTDIIKSVNRPASREEAEKLLNLAKQELPDSEFTKKLQAYLSNSNLNNVKHT